jgi:hypothetical protein
VRNHSPPEEKDTAKIGLALAQIVRRTCDYL